MTGPHETRWGGREIKSLQSEKARGQKTEYIIKSHVHNRKILICNMHDNDKKSIVTD